MARVSAGILPYRRGTQGIEVLIVHPGGPLWASRDEGAWSIAKGELEPGEAPEEAAVREFREETGWEAPGPLLSLGEIRLRSGKRVHAFAIPLDVDPNTLVSGTFSMEWPRRSGRQQSFPEIDRAAWFSPAEARMRLNPAQEPLLDRLVAAVASAVP